MDITKGWWVYKGMCFMNSVCAELILNIRLNIYGVVFGRNSYTSVNVRSYDKSYQMYGVTKIETNTSYENRDEHNSLHLICLLNTEANWPTPYI